MSVYTQLVSNLFFPFHERLKGHNTLTVRRSMEETQWWDSARMHELQLQRLRSLLIHAGCQVPYYRQMFQDIDFDPASVTDLTDLQRLPFLTKTLIRGNLESLKSKQSSGLAPFNTGGSSGEPLSFFIGKERVSHDVAAKWRATRWWDVDIGDPEIVVWGSPIELDTQDYLRRVRDRLLRTELLPAFEMTPAKLDQFIAAIRTRRPKMLFGYPSALAHIARHAQGCGVWVNDLGIRVAFVTSERLYDEQRALIEETFGCPVANGYGGRDAGFIAHQCPAGGMHITAEDIIVEIVNKDEQVLPPGQSGEIVVTHLATCDFPFIRYHTGDIGVLDVEVCSCGRGLPLLKEIQGRTTDFVVGADGTVMHALALIYVMRALKGIGEFKFIQHSLDRVEILVVPNQCWDSETKAQIVSGIQARLGDVQVQVCLMDLIPPEPSGKHRYVVSHVPLPTEWKVVRI